MPQDDWVWDPTLYAGSAPFYPVGRVEYPPELAERLAAELAADGTGRLVDVGCGPGSLTLLLAPLFADVVGVDADADMLVEAARQAERAGVRNVTWRRLRGEELPADLPRPSVVTFAQSFHWMDRPRVAGIVRDMLDDDGALVVVHAQTDQGIESDEPLARPRPPRAAVGALVRRHLGEVPRAGRSTRPRIGHPRDEHEIEALYRAAGFRGPRFLELPPRVVQRTAEQVRASIYSLSGSAPHLFGPDLDAFDAELRALLDEVSPDGLFSEHLREITIAVWRPAPVPGRPRP